ncbi:helix-turn-helix domain-containing protein [Flavobacterium cerinum]|uniref:Helix-turn-helix domain-containing protein n=1 Tax=Flavobacterium cerinum TaxID=2502784 RepID=A0ABY5IS84_9FLAO|nr:helix-turn-helix domain-containing protein [Flavobacterium cerinum]UUC44316.1 helix-turn-helix domain-containing protein [Flavobacterium cerinum]
MKYNKVQSYCLLLFIFTWIVSSDTVMAQAVSKQQLLFNESEELVYSKPDEALKVAQHLLKNAGSGKENAKINLLLAKIYEAKGDYNNALTYLYEANKGVADLSERDAVEVSVTQSGILRALYFDNQSLNYFKEARHRADKIKDPATKGYALGLLQLEKTMMNLERENYKAALQNLNRDNFIFKDQSRKDEEELALWIAIAKARIYSSTNEYTKAEGHFSAILKRLDTMKVKNNYIEVFALSGMASVYFHKKEHSDAIRLLLKALQKSQPFENLYFAEILNKQIAINYLALNDTANYKFYNTNFLKANAEVEKIEQESVNTAYNLITQEYENQYLSRKQNYITLFYTALGLTFAIIVIGGLFWFKFHSKKKRLREIISYLEVTRNNLIIGFTEKKEVTKKSTIPQETEQALLAKLKRFENSTKFTSNDMSLAVLAGQFETNTKYLSEIINKHYDMNFNTYINKLRINYIVEKLKSDPNFRNYKISYLAENSGFSSHSSFATVFKSITGIAPITFIELLKNEMEVTNG